MRSVLVAGLLSIGGICTTVDTKAGNIDGPATRIWTVSGNSTDTWTYGFREDEPAYVKVKGDGSSDLDCYVTNNDGDVVAKDDDATDLCYLRWTPPATRKYRIQVRNRGSRANEYTITTN
jgi:hypothetical protein